MKNQNEYPPAVVEIIDYACERVKARRGTGNMSHGDWKGLFEKVLSLVDSSVEMESEG